MKRSINLITKRAVLAASLACAISITLVHKIVQVPTQIPKIF